MRSRPVISKIRMMFSSVQTMSRLPLRGRTRFAPLTRTPNAVESMKVRRDKGAYRFQATLRNGGSEPVREAELLVDISFTGSLAPQRATLPFDLGLLAPGGSREFVATMSALPGTPVSFRVSGVKKPGTASRKPPVVTNQVPF